MEPSQCAQTGHNFFTIHNTQRIEHIPVVLTEKTTIVLPPPNTHFVFSSERPEGSIVSDINFSSFAPLTTASTTTTTTTTSTTTTTPLRQSTSFTISTVPSPLNLSTTNKPRENISNVFVFNQNSQNTNVTGKKVTQKRKKHFLNPPDTKCFKRSKPCMESPNEIIVKQESNIEEEEEQDVKPSLSQIDTFSITAEDEEEEKSKILTCEIDNMLAEIGSMM